jgi:hypothetical protein
VGNSADKKFFTVLRQGKDIPICEKCYNIFYTGSTNKHMKEPYKTYRQGKAYVKDNGELIPYYEYLQQHKLRNPR